MVSQMEVDEEQVAILPPSRVIKRVTLKPQKRRRTRKKETTILQSRPDLLSPLPHELLAEIMLYSISPRDLLAVARCSKQLFSTMALPSFDYVWRQARLNCLPYPLPPPLPNYTEIGFASLIYGGGICEICQRSTDNMYASFALKLRLCDNPNCQKTFLNSKAKITSNDYAWSRATGRTADPARDEILKWMIISEVQALGQSQYSHSYDGLTCRQSEWDDAVSEYQQCLQQESLQAYRDRHKLATLRKERIMSFYKAVYGWKRTYMELEKKVVKANERLSKTLAEEEGWEFRDMVNTHDYHSMLRWKKRSLENITKEDYQLIRSPVDVSLLGLNNHRQNRKTEMSRSERAKCLQTFYARLRSAQDSPKKPMPPLRTFMRLPAVRVVLTAAPTDNLPEDLKKMKGTLASIINGELDKWREGARAALAAVLGYPNWKTSHSNILHPVDRITARFVCKRCRETLPLRKKEKAYFTYFTACSHQCGDPLKEWDASWFVKDEQVIDIMSRMLEELGVRDEKQESITRYKALHVHCRSCPDAEIVMPTSAVIRHCRRHDSMQYDLIKDKRIVDAVLVHPLIQDIEELLMGRSPKAKRLRESKNRRFGCRHCEQQLPGPEPQISSEVPAISTSKKGYGLYTFNGMMSHLKTKHSVADPRDEDFYLTGPTPA